ncbi:MAG: DUF2975 domain-containing protein [Oscillospiraceae bacterium]|nr:DUF2975 domain-containing protein [Oscillospiraceae bacterium]
MNNKKMARVAKNLDILANVFCKIAAIAGIICVAVAILSLIFGGKIFAEAAHSPNLDLDFIKLHLTDKVNLDSKFMKLYVCISTLGGGIVCFLVAYIAGLLRKILSPMKIGRPFEEGISQNLKNVGWAIIVGGFISEVLGCVARMLLINAYPFDEFFSPELIRKTEYVFTINFNFVIIACAVFLLSYIFSYGQILQRESDETL